MANLSIIKHISSANVRIKDHTYYERNLGNLNHSKKSKMDVTYTTNHHSLIKSKYKFKMISKSFSLNDLNNDYLKNGNELKLRWLAVYKAHLLKF